MPDAPDNKTQVHRRRSDGLMEVGPDWETLIERQIREGMARGLFDNLPHQGERLPDDDNSMAGDRGPAFHVLQNYGVAPPWIEADKDVRALLEKCDAILARAAKGPAPSGIARRRDLATLEDIVVRANAAIERLNADAPTYSQQRRPLVLAEALARYDEACRR
jgi:hypothetical protein